MNVFILLSCLKLIAYLAFQKLTSMTPPIIEPIWEDTLTYVGIIVGPLLFCLVVGLLVFASMMRKQRSLHGTYNPQKQEINAPRFELTDMSSSTFKYPAQERLIWSNQMLCDVLWYRYISSPNSFCHHHTLNIISFLLLYYCLCAIRHLCSCIWNYLAT